MCKPIAFILLVLWLGPAYAQQKAWEKEWNEATEGGKKEGKVVVATSPDPVMREIAAKFKARFGITLEHLAGSSTQLAARLETERQAGINSVDVFLGGVQTVANVLYPQKMLDPLSRNLFFLKSLSQKDGKAENHGLSTPRRDMSSASIAPLPVFSISTRITSSREI